LLVLYESTTITNGVQCVMMDGICPTPRLHVDNLVLPKLWDIGTGDEGLVKSGCTTWDVLVQRPHYTAVLTMDGEMFTLTATVTRGMLVLFVLVTKVQHTIIHDNIFMSIPINLANVPSTLSKSFQASFEGLKSQENNVCKKVVNGNNFSGSRRMFQ